MRKLQSTMVALVLIGISFAFTQCTSKPEKTAPKADQKADHKTICLNMIVKNESAVITRSMASALPMIDYWVIVDTGSTDGTQQIIKDFMKEKGVPGELYERPWVNFSHNRNEALSFAKDKSDYVLFLDADDYLAYEPGFALPPLDMDYYYMPIKFGGTAYSRIFLVNNHQDWKWEGVLHEVICPPPERTAGTLDKVANVVTTEGARSKDPKKYEKDAAILEAELLNKPDDTRTVFYLAQSYANAGNKLKAMEIYEKRVQLGGWPEEVFWSMLQVARLRDELGLPKDSVVDSYKRACSFRSTRIEPYYYLANYYRRQNDFDKAMNVAGVGLTLPRSKDLLFVEAWMYDYGMLLEYSVSAYWCDRFKESQAASLALLKRETLPQDIRELVERNLGYANAKLVEQTAVPVSIPVLAQPRGT